MHVVVLTSRHLRNTLKESNDRPTDMELKVVNLPWYPPQASKHVQLVHLHGEVGIGFIGHQFHHA
jgi:hypothetical protein